MPLVTDLSKAQLAFQVAGGDADQFLVLRYRGTEGLCQLYRFEIELASSESRAAFDAIVGRPAVLSIDTEFGQRWFHGIVSRFEMTGETSGQTYFRAELVPTVWLLTHRYNSRIFQNQSVPEIISDVLDKAGIAPDRVKLDTLQRTHEPREYCVQYRETDYNFICRLMEEEGIRWYFEQSKEAHHLVLEDGAAAGYTPIEGDSALCYRPPSGMLPAEDHICRFRLGRSVRPGAVALNDFNFENPKLDLRVSGNCGRDPGLEVFDYPGEYAQQKTGQELAGLRAEEFEAGRTTGVGQSNNVRLAPGRTFELTDHPGGLDGAYLLTSVTYEGKQSTRRTSTALNGRNGTLDARLHQALQAARKEENESIRQLAEAILQVAARLKSGDPTAHRELTQWLYHAGQVTKDLPSVAGAMGGSPLEALSIPNLLEDMGRAGVVDEDAPVYTCRFECIPATVAYRPPRVTPWPQMRGTQTARVVGPESEEIHTDEYGRVKVQFNWDREGSFNENSSCWIRVSQGMAGGAYGMMFLPRVGQEVVVDFLEGDPDRPIITGRVYNADHMPPYELPKEKTKSCIKTNSTKGGGGTNEIRFDDLKGKEQILLYAQKDLHLRVNNDRVENVDHDRHLTVKEQKFELVKKSKHNEVKLDFNEKVGGKMSLEIQGDLAQRVGGNRGEEVAGNYALKSDSKIVVEAPEVTLKAGGNFIKIDASGVTILGTMVKINSGGSAGMANMIAPTKPEASKDADTAKPGKDVTYTGGEELAKGETGADVAGIFESNERDDKKTSWIEIELVDEIGQPVPGEKYEVIEPDSETVHRGSLDKLGQAHVAVSDPGECQISFPNLDSAAWQRPPVPPPAVVPDEQALPAAGGTPTDGTTGDQSTDSVEETDELVWTEDDEAAFDMADDDLSPDDDLELSEDDVSEDDLEMNEEEFSELDDDLAPDDELDDGPRS